MSVELSGIGQRDNVGLSRPLRIEYCDGRPVCVLLGISKYSSGETRCNCKSVLSLFNTTSRASIVVEERS